eukprot:scaffold197998_cov34-Tisochrysis_lutea.AAC.4
MRSASQVYIGSATRGRAARDAACSIIARVKAIVAIDIQEVRRMCVAPGGVTKAWANTIETVLAIAICDATNRNCEVGRLALRGQAHTFRPHWSCDYGHPISPSIHNLALDACTIAQWCHQDPGICEEVKAFGMPANVEVLSRVVQLLHPMIGVCTIDPHRDSFAVGGW